MSSPNTSKSVSPASAVEDFQPDSDSHTHDCMMETLMRPYGDDGPNPNPNQCPACAKLTQNETNNEPNPSSPITIENLTQMVPNEPNPSPILTIENSQLALINGPDAPISLSNEKSRLKGRPKGSKNKSKPAVVYMELEPNMKKFVLEIQPGLNIYEVVRNYGQAERVGISVENGLGQVQNVLLHNPDPKGKMVYLSETYDISSISGLFVGPSRLINPQHRVGTISYLVVQVVGARGETRGGVVACHLLAASTVYLNVTTFASYNFRKFGPNPNDPSTSQGGFGPIPDCPPGFEHKGLSY